MGLFSKLFGKFMESSISIQQKPDNKDIQSTEVPVRIATKESEKFDVDIPPLQGDYAKTIFLYANNRPSSLKSSDVYQRYLLYECGIRNPLEYHQTLIDEGYFELTSTVEFLNGLKVVDLKAILSEYGLSVTGKKENLIERIIENVNEGDIKKHSTEMTYSISKKGREYLEEHHDYVELHRHKNWNIDWKEYDANKKPGYSFYDVVWGILNERLMTANHYGRNEYLCMYQLLEEEGKSKSALEMLLRVIYIDFSGLDLLEYIKLYKTGIYTIETMKEYFASAIMIAPGLINAIPKYIDVYDDEMIEKIYQWQLPIQVCEKKLFYDIIHSVVQGTYDGEKTENKLKIAYNKSIENLIKQ